MSMRLFALKLDKFNDVNLLQLKNMYFILLTKVVLKLERFKDVKE